MLSNEVVQSLLRAECADMFSVLGMHEVKDGLAVRAFLPGIADAAVVERGGQRRWPMQRTRDEGLFEVDIDSETQLFAYALEVVDLGGGKRVQRDPYSFWPMLNESDRYLFNEGKQYSAQRFLGARPKEVDGVAGAYFAVWAPSARRVSVVGDFNNWDGRCHGMRPLGDSGIWEIFLPQVGAGAVYKYEILTQANEVLLKCDPYAFAAELPPSTASVVADIERFVWGDEEWMRQRGERSWVEAPVSIYEVHPGSWRYAEDGSYLNWRDMAHQLVEYALDMNFTHLELMPVAEHPFDGSWGYQVTGYFAPTSRFGTPEDFAYFVDYCHQNGIAVLVDWVPGHFPKDAHGLARFDGTGLYEHLDTRQGWHPDWDTMVFNYGRDEVRSFLLSNALFWLEHYHVDGLRVDAVASMLYLDYSRKAGEWVPNRHGGRENLEAIEFLKELNTAVYARCPGAVMIAEESTAWPAVSRPVYAGGLGFGFKWNMGWMNDVLHYMAHEPVHRKWHHGDLTFSMIYAYHENFVLPLSHDEVVHGKGSLLAKMPGDDWQKFANLRLLYGFMYGHPGKKLLFMGAELAPWHEWRHAGQLDWSLLQYAPHRGIQQWLRDLNALYCQQPSLHKTDADPRGFAWIDCLDMENSVVSFLRRAEGGRDLIFACNFTPVPRDVYRLGVPSVGRYRELLNSDAQFYGGSGVGNSGEVVASASSWHSQPASLELRLPPLGILVLQQVGD
jgi:1,4-alpha-glucan branching enzyme